MTTPADELRTAAATLRRLATNAADDSGSSHWEAIRVFPEYPDSTATRLRANPGGMLLHGGGKQLGPVANAPVGDYIAAMDPAVALALATLLEAVLSSNQEASPAHEECDNWCIPDTCDLAAALAVARQINGGQP